MRLSALLIYEFSITFARECNAIWGSRPGFFTLLFFVNRYGTILNAVALFVLFFPMENQVFSRLQGVLMILPYLSWIVFSAFRAYALADRTLLIGFMVLILSSGFVGLTIWQLVLTSVQDLPSPFDCSASIVNTKQLSIGGTFMIAEIMVIVFTLKRTLKLTTRRNRGPRTLMSIVLQNSLFYSSLLIPFLFNALVLVNSFTVTQENQDQLIFRALLIAGNFRDPITSILISRFLLNLGELSHSDMSTGDSLGNIISSDITMHPSDVISLHLPLDRPSS
ncbi:hypothetical protein BD310DRAFT_932390 [Dichomitus squalens]|uniref:DUF6533 domain-containing protein n=1 Tax=Dichomitus squalens TaxID=114155 RepID=A0A4Q9PP41_9APHY|nr:hypothetical protein BD310DRAFT_932390 [Dichomitus squalens]